MTSYLFSRVFRRSRALAQGRSEGGSWGAREPPFEGKSPTIFRGENAMTIMFDTVWSPPPPLKNPGYAPVAVSSHLSVVFFALVVSDHCS